MSGRDVRVLGGVRDGDKLTIPAIATPGFAVVLENGTQSTQYVLRYLTLPPSIHKLALVAEGFKKPEVFA